MFTAGQSAWSHLIGVLFEEAGCRRRRGSAERGRSRGRGVHFSCTFRSFPAAAPVVFLFSFLLIYYYPQHNNTSRFSVSLLCVRVCFWLICVSPFVVFVFVPLLRPKRGTHSICLCIPFLFFPFSVCVCVCFLFSFSLAGFSFDTLFFSCAFCFASLCFVLIP